jgi:hypothetical protein
MKRPLRPLLVALLAVLAALLVAGSSFAGTLQVRDSASLLTPADRHAIESAAERYPFDVRVLTTTDYADQPSFSRYVGAQVSAPDMVVVGIDPAHHHTQVHFGTGSRVDRSQWSSIERAGNPEFREGRWAAGVIAILDAASAATAGAPVGRQSSGSAGWIIGAVVVVAMGLFAIVVVALLVRWAMRSAGSGYANPGPGYGYGPGYGGPGYGPGPGYGGGQGIGPVGGGIIGAGLGGVAGYELGKLEGEREERERRREEYDPGPSDSGDSGGGGSFDAGGGGSSWDSGGDGGGGGGGGDSGGGGGSDW